MADGKLTLKQELFIAAYLGEARGNASEAARIAGYKKPGQEGHRLLKKAEIASRVSQQVAAKYATADEVLQELTDVAMAPWQEFVEVLSRDKQGRPVRVRMDLTNKVKALELLGKHHQVFIERQDVNITIRRHEVIGVPNDALTALFRPAQITEQAEA